MEQNTQHRSKGRPHGIPRPVNGSAAQVERYLSALIVSAGGDGQVELWKQRLEQPYR